MVKSVIKNGDNVILKFRILDGELCRDNGKAYIYPSMARALQYYHPNHEELVEYTPIKHGHWIVEEDGNWRNVKCSACGKEYACHYGMLQLQNFGYCPNCGADMRSDKNET